MTKYGLSGKCREINVIYHINTFKDKLRKEILMYYFNMQKTYLTNIIIQLQ